ncbi:MAG: hypothetical protein SFW35_09810 [Chitinophagales bacterium]|nr:hypothetical protein [Chitinophagales bacterium]
MFLITERYIKGFKVRTYTIETILPLALVNEKLSLVTSPIEKGYMWADMGKRYFGSIKDNQFHIERVHVFNLFAPSIQPYYEGVYYQIDRKVLVEVNVRISAFAIIPYLMRFVMFVPLITITIGVIAIYFFSWFNVISIITPIVTGALFIIASLARFRKYTKSDERYLKTILTPTA